jgi:hypothetical protein
VDDWMMPGKSFDHPYFFGGVCQEEKVLLLLLRGLWFLLSERRHWRGMLFISFRVFLIGAPDERESCRRIGGCFLTSAW